MDLSIHRAHPFAAPELTKIAFASKGYWQYPSEWMVLWTDELTVTETYIGAHDVFGACLSDEVVGWYALESGPKTWEIDYFWVRPDRIGTRIGSVMFKHAWHRFEASGAGSLKVISDPNAEAFYRKMGFKRVGMHPSKPEGRFLPVLLREKI